MRHTRGQTGERRSHHALTAVRLSKCEHCGEMHVRHVMCEHCGYYRGKQVVDVAALRARKEKRQKEKLKAMGKSTDAARDATADDATEEKRGARSGKHTH